MSVSESEINEVYDDHVALLNFVIKWSGGHPEFTEDIWREVVCSGHTMLGYWEWAYELDHRFLERGIAE